MKKEELFVEWEHIKQICERLANEDKSARELCNTLIFAVEQVRAVKGFKMKI
jgi:hypothetical protein